MKYGRNIRIYLSDGTVGGLRHAEIVNWTGQAIACPRSRFSELSDWPETKMPGIYFLLTKADANGSGEVYVGESENVYQRLTDHVRSKDFWNEVILFTNKDENLTKSHVKFLESRLIQLIQDAGRYELHNSNSSVHTMLPRGDIAAMEEFLSNIRILIGTLGHRLLEPIIDQNVISSAKRQQNPVLGVKLEFKFKGLSAYGAQLDEGFVVFTGSQATPDHAPRLPKSVQSLREQFVENGLFITKDDHYVLIKDYVFSSSSTAASVLSGTARNGLESWKDAVGKPLKYLQESMVAQTSNSFQS